LRKLSSILALMLCFTLGPPVVFAGPFEDGLAAASQKDYATALRLLRPLAEQGVAEAQHMLGLMYRTGQGVPQDYVQEAVWSRKAAEQGVAEAQLNLGNMYHNGEGVPQDYVQAVAWYRKAAEQGNASAQYNLGLKYANGEGVPQDYVQAHKWLNLAAAGSLPDEADARKRAAKGRDIVAAKMTPAQIAEAQRLASQWKPK